MTAPAPYPSDVRAKGWRFELDHERIEQSDTWALAPPELRPWLLMLWLAAWKQMPCGSLPNQDELIAARIGMPLGMFQEHKAILMRGWWQADDGRQYHDTVVERVQAMLDAREKERARKSDWRGKGKKEVPRDNTVTPMGLLQDSIASPKGVTAPEPVPEPNISPIPPTGGEKSSRRAAVSLPAWLAAIRAAGEKPVPENDPVRAYATEVGLSDELMRLAWFEFRQRYSEPGAKRYRDWRAVFRKAVRGNWLRLWYRNDDGFALTTAGHQAQAAMEAAA